MSSDERKPGDDQANSLDPASILSGWREAFRTVSGEFLRPACGLLRGTNRDDDDPWDDRATARDSETGALARDPETGALARAARGFPVAGAAVGLGAALVFVIARVLGLPMAVAGAAAIAAGAFASGALFESGLARFGEAAVRQGARDEALAVMRGHTPGFYGIVVIVCVLAMKIGALAALAGTGRAAAALVAAAAVSWTAMPVLLYLLPAASERGLAARAGAPAFNELAIAAALAAAVALLVLGPWTGIIALAFAAAGAFKMYWFSRRMVGGVTGATLGAAQQAAETGVLVAVAAVG